MTFTGDFFRTPSGQPFTGDVDLTAIENGVTSHLTIGGLTLQPFLEFGPNGATVPTTTQPPLAEDIARAQAVVADAPPLPDDLRETGRWWLPEDELVLLLARTTIHQECMASAGFDYGTAPVDEWATYVGSWQPHVFLGIRGTRSASLGYQDVGSPQYERVYFESLDPEQQSAYDDAASGDCQVAVEQVLHESALGSELIGDASESRMWDAQQMALLDPRVQQAQAEWHDCVVAAVGDDEPTPNDLARKYLFEGGDQARSAEVAIADIDCQQQFDLEGVWYRTVTEYDRSLMGADVGLYDEQVRLLQQTVDLARRELTDRNIEVPTID